MTHWFTADTHVGHANIIKYCDRPFDSVYEMDRTILRTSSKLIQPGDTLFFLGDISMQPQFVERALAAMGNQIVFVFGNHDKKRTRKIVKDHPSVKWCGDFKEEAIKNQYIVMCHYAMRVWNRSHSNPTQQPIQSAPARASIQLFGHSHSGLENHSPWQMDVGIDNAYKILGEYRPFSFEEIKRQIRSQVKSSLGFHVPL